MGAVERWLTKGETDDWYEIRENNGDDPNKPGIVPWRGFVFFLGIPFLIVASVMLLLGAFGVIE